jgi:hypothetical protein
MLVWSETMVVLTRKFIFFAVMATIAGVLFAFVVVNLLFRLFEVLAR